MGKPLFVSLWICLLIFSLSGCYLPQDVEKASYAYGSEDSISSAYSTTGTSDINGSSENATNETTFTDTPTSDTSTSSTLLTAVTTSETSPSKTYAYDKYLACQCVNSKYDYTIIKSLVEGTIETADLEKLKAEISYYNYLCSAGRSSSFDANDPTVIGDSAATAKAKDCIKEIFGYEMAADVSPTGIIRYDFTESTSNEYLKWDTYYEVYFEISNPSPDVAELFYAINIDAKSGKCIGGNYCRETIPSTNIDYVSPPAEVISDMQNRAREFVANKNLVAGSNCVYVFSELTGLEEPSGNTSELQTEVYLDNGYIVDVHEGFQQGNRLYFNIFQSHGFKTEE